MLLFCPFVSFFLSPLHRFFFFPQADEADQKAAQVAQDEVSKVKCVHYSFTCENYKTPLTSSDPLLVHFPPSWGSSGLPWGLLLASYPVYAQAGQGGICTACCNYGRGSKFMAV